MPAFGRDEGTEIADPWHSRLLRAGRERPREYRVPRRTRAASCSLQLCHRPAQGLPLLKGKPSVRPVVSSARVHRAVPPKAHPDSRQIWTTGQPQGCGVIRDRRPVRVTPPISAVRLGRRGFVPANLLRAHALRVDQQPRHVDRPALLAEREPKIASSAIRLQ